MPAAKGYAFADCAYFLRAFRPSTAITFCKSFHTSHFAAGFRSK